MSSKGTEEHPQWPSGKGFVGNGRCRSWLADLMQFFMFQSVLFCSKPLRKLKYSSSKTYNPPQISGEQNFSHFIQKCSNRDCRNIQKCCKCSYRHSSSWAEAPSKANLPKTQTLSTTILNVHFQRQFQQARRCISYLDMQCSSKNKCLLWWSLGSFSIKSLFYLKNALFKKKNSALFSIHILLCMHE